jgi:hypothetical protein
MIIELNYSDTSSNAVDTGRDQSVLGKIALRKILMGERALSESGHERTPIPLLRPQEKKFLKLNFLA